MIQGTHKKGEKKQSKVYLILSILMLAGILLSLKTAATAPALAGKLHLSRLSILLPIGISFYSLQMIAYLADVYRGKIEAETNFFKYLLFITYFPHILQGPIPRYELLSQDLFKEHIFDYQKFVYGFELMLWGYFQKMVIADRAAIMVNRLFGEYQSYPGAYMLIAGILYSLQLYTDFNGCVCIAKGISGMFDITIEDNFHHPYFADSVKDFWRRWHMSLSGWLRDYIYIPLGGNRKGTIRKYINIMVVFIVSGIWHGIGNTFLVWGMLHGLYQIIGEVFTPIRNKIKDMLKIESDVFSHRLYKQLFTFFLVMLAWIFFRSSSVTQGVNMIKSMFTTFNPWILWDGSLYMLGLNSKNVGILVISLIILWVVSMLQNKMVIRDTIYKQSVLFRYMIVLALVFTILIFGIYGPGYDSAQFIYGGF